MDSYGTKQLSGSQVERGTGVGHVWGMMSDKMAITSRCRKYGGVRGQKAQPMSAEVNRNGRKREAGKSEGTARGKGIALYAPLT